MSTTLPEYVYAGAKAHEALRVELRPSATVPDLTVVTSAYLDVTKSDGTSATWTCTMANQTASTLRLTHEFAADGSDVAVVGSYPFTVMLSTVTGPRRGVPAVLVVKARS